MCVNFLFERLNTHSVGHRGPCDKHSPRRLPDANCSWITEKKNRLNKLPDQIQSTFNFERNKRHSSMSDEQTIKQNTNLTRCNYIDFRQATYFRAHVKLNRWFLDRSFKSLTSLNLITAVACFYAEKCKEYWCFIYQGDDLCYHMINEHVFIANNY